MIMKNFKALILFGVLVIGQSGFCDPTDPVTPEVPFIVVSPTVDHSGIGSGLTGPIPPDIFNFRTTPFGPRIAQPNFGFSYLTDEQLKAIFPSRFSLNPIEEYCPPKESDFIQLAKQFDTIECYDDKKSYTNLPAGTEITAEVNKDLILSDAGVCNCLYKKASTNGILANVLRTDEVNLEVSDVDKQVRNYQNGLAEVTKKMAEKSLASSFQASIIFDGNKEVIEAYKNDLGQEFLGAIQNSKSPGKPGVGFFPAMFKGLTDVKELSLQKDALDGTNRAERFLGVGLKNRTQFEAGIKRVNEAFKVPEPNSAILSESSYSSNQCVGGREFLAFKQLPSGDEIFSELDGSNFDERSWDYNSLKSEYTSFMVQSPTTKSMPANAMAIKRLKAKLNFLNKNPMIKSFMAAQSSYDDYFNRKKSDAGYQRNINSFIRDGKLLKNKQKLFEIMKKMAKDNICSRPGQKSSDCIKKSLNDGKLQTYKKDLHDLFIQPEVAEVAKIESKYDLFRDLDHFKNNRIVDPKTLPLTQEALHDSFVKETGLDPEECTEGNLGGDTKALSKCSQIYASYCKRVLPVVPRLHETEDSALADDIESTIAHDFNPDVGSNPRLREFNNSICNEPKRKNPSDLNEVPATFFSFKANYCSANGSKPECLNNSNESIATIRAKYMNEYKDSFTDEELNFNLAMKIDKVESMDLSDAHSIAAKPAGNNTNASGDSSEAISNWDKLAKSFGGNSNSNSNSGSTPGVKPGTTALADTKAVPFSGMAKSLSNLSSAMGGSSDSDVMDTQMNYSGAIMGGTQLPGQTAEVPKIESMPQTEREELLEDWKKEMAEWKANKGSDPSQSGIASANEAAMKAKIEALEQLLASQKQLTQDQYKLLNDSIAAQTKTNERSIASVQDETDEPVRNNRKRSGSGVIGGNPEVSDETQRAPGSVPNNLQQNTSGSGAGAGVTRSKTSGSSAVSDSRESVAREEAKLVNMRENSNGSITITSSNSGASSASANAIVVPVSDAIYLSASSPAGLNLSQIEASIPKDQIAKLQDQGEYFILLLQNGSNPPLEVKVKKEKNGLVQVDGAPIVSRNVSLEGLLNTLPTTR